MNTDDHPENETCRVMAGKVTNGSCREFACLHSPAVGQYLLLQYDTIS